MISPLLGSIPSAIDRFLAKAMRTTLLSALSPRSSWQHGRARHVPRRHRRQKSNSRPSPPENWSVLASSFSAPSHAALPA
jgi:hypothetical protein